MGRFHSRNGFYFERTSDSGDVTITLEDKNLTTGVTLPENEWASVVAHVCARGEDGKTWQEARDYHALARGREPDA